VPIRAVLTGSEAGTGRRYAAGAAPGTRIVSMFRHVTVRKYPRSPDIGFVPARGRPRTMTGWVVAAREEPGGFVP
jgi:hypothetical protein